MVLHARTSQEVARDHVICTPPSLCFLDPIIPFLVHPNFLIHAYLSTKYLKTGLSVYFRYNISPWKVTFTLFNSFNNAKHFPNPIPLHLALFWRLIVALEHLLNLPRLLMSQIRKVPGTCFSVQTSFTNSVSESITL